MEKYYTKLSLCIFGGPLGLHYWYTKKFLRAILFLLTLGGFGFWWIHDFMRLLVNPNYLSECIVNNEPNNEEKEYTAIQAKTNEEVKIESDLKFKETVKESSKILEEVNERLEVNSINKTDLYLNSFNDLPKYDINKKLDDTFLKKIKRVKEVEYEKFVKPSGTTNRPIDFVVFDLETTGLSPTSNEIIEIGAVRFKNDDPVEIFHTFIRPKKKISARITSINGITNEMVEDCPTIEDVLPRFIDFIGDDVLIAHNSDFDMKFILNQLYNQGYKKIKNKAIDTLKLSRQKVRDYDFLTERNIKLDSYKLEDLKYAFSLWDVDSHNAIDDCKVCAYVYLKIRNEYGDFCYID